MASINVSAESGQELTIGEPVEGYLSSTSSKEYYFVEVESEYMSLSVQTYDANSNSDFDLYVRLGAQPTTSYYDFRGYTNSPEETINIPDPSSGTYHIMVRSYSGSGPYTLLMNGESEDVSIITLENDVYTNDQLTGTGDSDLFKISVNSDSPSLDVNLDGPASGADFDLYTKRDGVPTTSSYDARGYTSSADEQVRINNPVAGEYYIMVRSYSGSGNYRIKAADHTGEDNTPPTISSVDVSNIVANSATVRWETNEAASSRVEYGTTSTLGANVEGSGMRTSHSVRLDALEADTKHYFKVVSEDGAGNSAESQIYSFYTTQADDLTPPSITNIQVHDLTENTATIGWETNEEATAQVEYGTTSDYGQTATESTLSTSHSLELSGLEADTQYHFRVSSTDSGGNTATSRDHRFATEGGGDSTPPEITESALSYLGTNSATITWLTDEPANGVVEYGTTSSYGQTAFGDSGVTSHAVTLTDLSPGTLYHVKLSSTDNAGNTGSTGDLTFTTEEEGVNPQALSLDGSAVRSSLSGQEDKNYYYVQVPENKASLRVELFDASTQVDFDLYLKKGNVPDTNDYDDKATTSSSSEQLTVSSPQSGTYYIMVLSYSGAGQYSLRASSTDMQQSTGDKIALCIGISNYRYINDLQYADDDARDWANYLRGQGYGVTTLIDSQATESAIYSAIDNIVASAEEDTRVAITFAGHGGHHSEGGYSSSAANDYGGQTDGHASQYFAWDADSSGHGCILDNVLANHLSGLKSDHVLIFFDNCRSGGMDEVAGDSGSGRYVIEACGWNEYSYDAPNYYNGAWTYWFLEWGIVNQGYTSFEQCFPAAASRYTSEHPDSHPEEIDHFPGPFMV